MTLELQSTLAEPPLAHRKRLPTRPTCTLLQSNPPCPRIEITDYDSLVLLLRGRADQMEISRSTIDYVSGLPDGFSAKILTLTRPRPPGADRTRDRRGAVRRIGLQSLGPLLDALCLKLIAVPDDEAFARNRSRLIKRDSPHFRSATARHKRKSVFEMSGTISARMFGWPAPRHAEHVPIRSSATGSQVD